MSDAETGRKGGLAQQTDVTRKSDRELVVTRTFNGPARIVFRAWTEPELLKRWWAPKSTGWALVGCEVDARSGGGYRFEFSDGQSGSMAFFGKYIEVVPNARLVWTNEEGEEGAVSTLTFSEARGQTLVVLSELYPSKEALDAAIAGMEGGVPEQYAQLDDLLAELGASA
ncbi:MAG: SRPBCC family protein [Hyphomicrobiaceae bacterium]|nr:SRPBCC family protein [Hyphomicrobiaceae bacterium]